MLEFLTGSMLGRILLLGATGTLIGALQGCDAYAKVQGKAGEVLATYRAGTLTAEVKANPPAVMAASEQTLRDRGYAIESSASTEEQGGIVARPPNYNLGKTMKIDVSPGKDEATKIVIWTNPWDEALARTTLDGILNRLGL